MKFKLITTAALLSLMSLSAPSFATAAVGSAAPAFSLTDTAGKTVSLADFKGKHVVLEWVNPGCPYVQKHYVSANMQATQKGAVDKGVVWLAINTTAKDHVDYKAPAAMAAWMSEQKAAASATLMDSSGLAGRAYSARTTPQVFVINPAGTIVYAGAIDNKRSANPADVKGATNHVNAALAETLAGKPVTVASTQSYGCSVKYSSM